MSGTEIAERLASNVTQGSKRGGGKKNSFENNPNLEIKTSDIG